MCFWRGCRPEPVHDLFFKSGPPPGGGFFRGLTATRPSGASRRLASERGDQLGFDVSGLPTRNSPELDPLAGYRNMCKWSCTIPGFRLTDEVGLTKTRWLRKFDTSEHVRSDIPLTAGGRPNKGYSFPVQGCNVELTEVQIVGHSEVWWTLGFEAFGDLDSVSTNLTLTLMPEKPVLERIVASGAFVSYPAWLLARRRE